MVRFPEIQMDEEVHRAPCRGANLYFARYFGEYRDRMPPVASVLMHTPAKNPGRMWLGMNPDFFKGTKVEDATRALAAQDQS